MEKFMLLFRGSEVYQPEQSPEALLALKEQMMDWVGDLISTRTHVASEPLTQQGVQVYGADKAITNTPFGAPAGVIGGCTIIQAINIAAAVEIAKSCPILATNANIEIRPIENLN